jgi:hypothetical protein
MKRSVRLSVIALVNSIALITFVTPSTSIAKRATAKKAAASSTASTTKVAPTSARHAVVVADETQIYEKPDLDSHAFATVSRGTKIPVSKGTRGDYAKFYRTRVKGKIGWVLTIDVRSESEAKKVFTKAQADAYKAGPFAEDHGEDEDGKKTREPFTFTRSVSFALGMNDYKESINGVDHSANLLTYGLKLTGPDVLLTGPLMDVNVMLHYGAPDYYTPLSVAKPSGFILWTDANLLLPLMARENFLVGVGAGPLLVISNIQASQGSVDYNMWQFNLGADVELTAGVRMGDFCLRFEGKYLFEKKTYRQLQVAFGTVF